MNIDQRKNPDPSRYSHWCEYGHHWHIIGATYQCGPDTEERERARQNQKEDAERYREERKKKHQ